MPASSNDMLFYDPVRGVVATALEYAIGPSNGHPAVPLAEAVVNARPAIEAQVQANVDRIAALQELSASIDENLSVSALRHKEAAIAVRTRVDEVVAALRRHEEATLATIDRDAEVVKRELEQRRAAVRDSTDALTRANNVLQDSLPSEAAGEPAPADGAQQPDGGDATAAATKSPPPAAARRGAPPPDVDVLCALATCKEILGATVHYEFPEDTCFKLAPLPAPAEDLAVLEMRPATLHFRPAELLTRRSDAAAPAEPASPQRSDEEVTNHPRRGGQADAASSGIVFAFGAGTAAGVDAREERNPLEGDDAPLDVIASVPVTGGDLSALSSPDLFAPAATRPFCRLAPVKDACLWWDFGEHRAVAVDEYTLVHGAATSWGALRAWSVLATNEMPPAFTAVDLEEDGAAAEEAVSSFFAEHCTVLDRRVKDSRLGSAPFNAVSFTAGNAAAARTYHRFVGIRIDGNNSAGHLNLLLAGAEWYGSVRARHS